MGTRISIDPKRAADTDYLCEPVQFPVVVEGEGIQTMTASRFCCVKHKLENGVFRILNPNEHENPRLMFITNGEGECIGTEKPGGEMKEGKSVPSLLTGTPYKYHYKDGNVMNNLFTNFETNERAPKRKWY
jgi:hypothetical protein